MKFLCDNCKAKYQIADEKVAGRTLRMTCRKCGHSILIRGRHLRASSVPAPAPAPSALRQAAARAPAPAAPPPPAPSLDQWHVAINDVPVGPIRRDEIARKIAAGAVRADSLVWREGFDDWRPLGQVPELRRLLEQASAPAVPSSRPAARRSSLPPADNVVPIGGRMGGGAALAPEPEPPADEATVVASSPWAAPSSEPQPAALAPEPSPATEPEPEAAEEPAAATAPSSPAAAATSDESDAAAAFVPPPAESPAADVPTPSAPPKQRVAGMTPVAWFVTVGAATFGIALGVVLAVRFMRPATPPTPAEPVAAAAPQTPAAAEQPALKPSQLEVPDETEEQPATEDDPPQANAEQGAKRRAAKQGGTTRTARTKNGANGAGSRIDAEAQRRLARFAGGSSARPLGGGTASVLPGSSGRRNRGKPLEAAQLARVVNKNKAQLGACYNRAIRGMSDPPTVRVDVQLKVGSSGAVTSVRVSGGSTLPGMQQCIRTTVKRWRFPPSGGGGEVKFPLVFQAG